MQCPAILTVQRVIASFATQACSARGHKPALPLLVSTDVRAGSGNESTSSGCRAASVHTQCLVEVDVKGTQVFRKAASRSKGIQTRPSVREVGPSVTYKNDLQDKTYEPTMNVSEVSRAPL
ncbi:hypothetical protein MRX96_034512 [Rhipicephalus microplus]